MKREEQFNDISPLEYYYGSGYKLINPICRIVADNPQYGFIIRNRANEVGGVAHAWRMLADSVSVRMVMVLKSTLDSKTWDRLEVDDFQMHALLTGAASSEELRAYGASGDQDRERILVRAHRDAVSSRLGSLLLLATRVSHDIHMSRSRPSQSWLIRGDTHGMIKYLRSEGIYIPENTGANSVVKSLRSEWSTNQFFSTSTGDELASLAGRALVWVIHIDPARTKSREGGSYVSESEVLFPYGTSFHIHGYAEVSSQEQIARADLNDLPRSAMLRERMQKIYAKGANAWPEKRCRFIFAEEQ